MGHIRTYNDWAKEIIGRYGTRGGEKMIKAMQEELRGINSAGKGEGEECESNYKR